MKILFVPIDNRPVCYQLPKMIADISEDVELMLPPKKLLGGLSFDADVIGLIDWIRDSVSGCDSVVLSLDTIAYGGLIPSRRSSKTYEEIKFGVETLINIIKSTDAKIYAFSSIMRISNNNFNEEEKEYWAEYGEKIFRYSYDLDKFGSAKTDVPDDIIEDYLKTRKRNFEINKLYLEYYKQGVFDTLIFSKDDCAEYGLNVKEAKELESLGGFTKTGADEIPLTLLGRAINVELKVHPIFLEPEYKNLISNYEDISIEKSVIGQLELAGCDVTDATGADILLYVNNFRHHQGEIVMKKTTDLYDNIWTCPEKKYAIADVRLANGADNNFVSKILAEDFRENFMGYAAWNTSANTLGSLICLLKFIQYAKLNDTYNDVAFKKLQILRFLDDWAYQANVRQELERPDVNLLKDKMQIYENILKSKFESDFVASYAFPWKRLFEVEIELN